MANEFAKHTLEDILKKFDEGDLAGGEVPLTPEEVVEQPQVKFNESMQYIDDPRFGKVQLAKPGPRMSGTPLKIHGPPPLHGEHTVEVLKSLGYTAAEITQFQKEGSIISKGAVTMPKL